MVKIYDLAREFDGTACHQSYLVTISPLLGVLGAKIGSGAILRLGPTKIGKARSIRSMKNRTASYGSSLN